MIDCGSLTGFRATRVASYYSRFVVEAISSMATGLL